MEDPFAWQENAPCKGVDLAYFFRDQKPKDGGVRGNYRTICKECPVKSFCLEFALLYNLQGVWGGLSEKRRNTKYYKDLQEMLIEDAIESGVYIKELRV